MSETLVLPRGENQARGLAQYALDFLAGKWGEPSEAVLRQVERFHVDSAACAVSALACRTNAPRVLRREALESPAPDWAPGATLWGSDRRVSPEKAVLANCAAVREWDSNGTNFGYDPGRGRTAGEFGHNDYYPVAVAAAQQVGLDGRRTLRALLLVDEIRGRLAEVFSLKRYKIDHVLHGGIASAVVYGAVTGASVDEIESALGLLVAHHVPYRAIRAGKQLSDSKGASAAITAEAAVAAVRRARRGFRGPADIFRNPEAVFCLNQKPARAGESPFDLELGCAGDAFTVLGMHFKIGLYEHQSAGALQGVIDLLRAEPGLLEAGPDAIRRIRITIYEPAYGIICDPAKRDPRTRQSADHSMPYLVSALLRKAFATGGADWPALMLLPDDFRPEALVDPGVRSLMERIELVHGGPEYDAKYPDGIPTTVEIDHAGLGALTSGLVLYPEGHALNRSGRLDALLEAKFERLAGLGVADPAALRKRFSEFDRKPSAGIARLYEFPLLDRGGGYD